MRNNSSPSAGSTIVDKLKVYEGGTGVTDAASARTQLGAVAASDLNQPNGIAKLGNDGLLPVALIPDDGPSPISVQGVSSVVVGSTSQFTITNYDIFTDYQIAAILGTVSRTGALIVYTAPATPGAGGFTINGRSINVTVDSVRPTTPVLTGTSVGSGTANAAVVLSGSAFAMNSASANTHLNTDWQVASDAAFTTIVTQSLTDATNKTAWTSGNLNFSTTYYARVRYRDSASGVSNWSTTFSFTTKAAYIPNIEQAKMVASDRTNGSVSPDNMGWAVSISSDGNRTAVASHRKAVSGQSYAGQVYIYKRTGTTWAEEAKIIVPGTITASNSSDQFGYSISLDNTGTRVVIGSPYNDLSGTSNAGTTFVYLRTDTTWALEQSITCPAPTGSACFGAAVSISGDGTRAAITRTHNNLGNSGSTGSRVYIYLRTGTVWAQETQLTTDTGNTATFGDSIAMDSTGTRVVIGVPLEWNAGGTDYTGFVYVFRRTGTAWAQEFKYNNAGYAVADYFGMSVSVDATATRMAIGTYRDDYSATDCGTVRVFVRSGTSWAQEAVLTISDPAASAYYGYCVSINADGSLVTAGAPSKQAFYVHRRTGTSWTQVSKVQPSDRLTTGANNNFGGGGGNTGPGQCIAIDTYGSTVVIGANSDTNGSVGYSQPGAVYIYTS